MQTSFLRPTAWLSKRLGLSASTIERLRASHPDQLPPHITIGNSIRYDEAAVESWLIDRLRVSKTHGDLLLDQVAMENPRQKLALIKNSNK